MRHAVRSVIAPALVLAFVGLAACGSTRDEAVDASDSGAEDSGAAPDANVRVDARPPVDGAPVDAAAPAACGSRGSQPCPNGSFCYRDGNCGEADQGGTCVVPPSACSKDLAPVCGCDGRTYGNACEAQRAGVSARASGNCPGVVDAGGSDGGEGAPCGGFAGLACERGLFCLEPAGQCLTVADGMGTCASRPGVCPSNFAPVCGCDRVTYPNECVARAAGQSVARTGACP